MTTTQATDLKPYDEIVFDFRGEANHLGEVTVLDSYTKPLDHRMTVLTLTDGRKTYLRTVWFSRTFTTKKAAR